VIPRPEGVEIRPIRSLSGRRRFVDLPFRIHGGDPNWVPPLRLSVYDRLSPRSPMATHQQWALWLALRNGHPVGRIGACVDRLFDEHQGERWGWVGFFDSFDDPEVAARLFEVSWDWCRRQGAVRAVGPANFTTNDELGLMVHGFDRPPALMTLQNPRYYQALWEERGWEPAMDLFGYRFEDLTTDLSERQRRTLDRLKQRSGVTVRGLDMASFDAEVGKLFDLYNAAWQNNWGFAPLPEADMRHLAKQLRQVIRPEWVFALEKNGIPVAVCITIPDANRVMQKLRTGRLFPTGWARLLLGVRKTNVARVWALGVRPDVANLALGPLLYAEIVDRLRRSGVKEAEASWTLSTNHRINDQIEAMGGRHSRTWRLYQRAL
jgi:GNAT superfamily N-acetyltransferase